MHGQKLAELGLRKTYKPAIFAALEKWRVVGNQTMATADELQGELRLACPAVTRLQDAAPRDLQVHTGNRDAPSAHGIRYARALE